MKRNIMTDNKYKQTFQNICTETPETENSNNKLLKNIMTSPSINIAERINIAIVISKSIQEIHSCNIIHNNLNPNIIYINDIRKYVQIKGLQKYFQQNQEFSVVTNYKDMTDQLAYLSPEQTSYMNRLIDYRSDYYSLGVLLYELFTAQLPFHEENHYKMIIAHLSKTPDPLFMHNTDIPPILSEIVLKLLSKKPEDRYQSMNGLIKDLEECQRQLDIYKTIEPFPIARKDFPERLNIPQKLYGREAEIKIMEAAFNRVKNGAKEMLLITGPSCIGKTYLVKNMQLSVVIQNGFFVSGKYDQFQKNIPYSGIIAALRDLIRQVSRQLVDTDWKNSLKKLITTNGLLLTQQIPELEPIIQAQNKNTSEEQTVDFKITLHSLIRFFCNKFTMTFFLDDLQWVDPASLLFIEELMTDNSLKNLLFICVYRQIDVNDLHPLMLTVKKMINESALINTIIIEKLKFEDLHNILHDTLTNANKKSIFELAISLYDKTKGNPFQVREFLQYAKNKSIFVNVDDRWKWDNKQIQTLMDFKDEIDLMMKRINLFSKDEQIVLQRSACLGGIFESVLLPIICKDQPETPLNIFHKLLSEQFFIPVTDEREITSFIINGNQRNISQVFKFSHDCIQKASYELLSEKEKYKIHLDVGLSLKENIQNYKEHSILFSIVNNLDKSIHLITNKEEKKNLLLMYYLAGSKAKDFSAYETALKYFKKSIELNSKNSWKNDYTKTFNQFIMTAETARLCGDYDLVETITKKLLNHATDLSDKMDITEIQIQAYMSQSKILDAIHTALNILNQVGIQIPEKPNFAQLFNALLKAIHAMAGKKFSDLETLPRMEDPVKRKAMRLLFRLYSPAYQSNTNLLYYVLLKHIIISIRHGNTKESAFAYAGYGSMLIRLLKEKSIGKRLGKIALNVHSKIENEGDSKSNRSVLLLFINLFVSHWEEDLQNILPEFLNIYHESFQAGEIEYAANALAMHSAYSFFIGKKLNELNHEMLIHSKIIKEHKQESVYRYHMALKRIIENLLETNDQNSIDDLSINQKPSENISYILFIENYSRHFTNLIFNNYSDSYKYMVQAKKYLDSVFGTMTYVLFHCTASLAMIGVYPKVDGNQQTYILAKVSLYKKKLKKWAFMAEKNYLEKYYIIEAEYSRIMGNDRKAMKYYDLAIESANKNRFIHFQAFINEYAARFYLFKNKTAEASFYLNESMKKYLEWEAFAKVNQLNDNQDYIDLMQKKAPIENFHDSFNGLPILFNDYTDKNNLFSTLMKTYADFSSAQNVIILASNNDNWLLSQKTKDNISITNGSLDQLLQQCGALHQKCICYTLKEHIFVLANSPSEIAAFMTDFQQAMKLPMSILCLPLIVNKNYIGVVYLEHNNVKGLFTPGIVKLVEQFTSLAAVSINNLMQFQKNDIQARKTKIKISKRSHVLYRSGRTNKLGELASGVAHELNQPLSIINIHSGIIKRYFMKNESEAPEVEKVDKILSQIERTSLLIDKMLIFSRLKSDSLEFTKTDDQLKNLLHFFNEEFRIQEIKVDISIAENLPLARINGQKFDQIVIHLIMNAQYALAEKATELKRSFEKHLSISLYCEDDDKKKAVIFQISDNGIGMSQDVLDNCLSPFYSTKEPGEAMGLGLFYINTIVKEYQLNLTKGSQEGDGSFFSVSFPLA